MNPKDFIEQLKDYADIADASYAMLHYVDENEIFDRDDDEFRAKIPAFELQGRWVYADGIKLGYEIKEKNINKSVLAKQLFNDKKIKLGQPTAYALAIEARFSQDIEIKKDENKKPKKIDNRIQNFIKRPDNDADISKQKILVATTKEQKYKDSSFTHILSTRTKNFVNRLKLLHYTSLESFFSQSGFSATLFYDTQATSKDLEYIFAIRGSNDANDIITDLKDIFASKSNPKEQYFDMLLFYQDCIKQGYITETTPLIVVGHSLGGALAQLFALSFATAENANIIKEVILLMPQVLKHCKFLIILILCHIILFISQNKIYCVMNQLITNSIKHLMNIMIHICNMRDKILSHTILKESLKHNYGIRRML